ncbi:MAG: hypothetical protein HRT44_00095 [Bdellovibrionales bacterium]|nr:hypothetical protein [Bdellovibrionales bacterium]NQZ17657.1 hypothetical protein [Bdellovibrionales bacterium]
MTSQISLNEAKVQPQSSCPKDMTLHVFEKSFSLPKEKADVVWDKLQRRETFIKGQLPPYKVEFETDLNEGPFEEGELNIHHGPLLSVHGIIGKVTKDYRDLSYFYGSYVISFRWIRPIRLEFFREENTIKLKIQSYVRPWIKPIWHNINNLFWKFSGITFLM